MKLLLELGFQIKTKQHKIYRKKHTFKTVRRNIGKKTGDMHKPFKKNGTNAMYLSAYILIGLQFTIKELFFS